MPLTFPVDMAAPCVGSLMVHCAPASLSGAPRPVEDAHLSWVCYTTSDCALQMKLGCLKSLLRMQEVAKELTEKSWCCRLHICCTLG